MIICRRLDFWVTRLVDACNSLLSLCDARIQLAPSTSRHSKSFSVGRSSLDRLQASPSFRTSVLFLSLGESFLFFSSVFFLLIRCVPCFHFVCRYADVTRRNCLGILRGGVRHLLLLDGWLGSYREKTSQWRSITALVKQIWEAVCYLLYNSKTTLVSLKYILSPLWLSLQLSTIFYDKFWIKAITVTTTSILYLRSVSQI